MPVDNIHEARDAARPSIALRNPSRFRSVSAFAPICAPSQVPWGEKAFRGYLGENRSIWARYDACRLLAEAPSAPPLRVDQGAADTFLETQLRPDRLVKAAAQGGHALDYRLHDGYDTATSSSRALSMSISPSTPSTLPALRAPGLGTR